MAWTYVASTKGYSLAAVSTYDSEDALNLSIGDVLCIYVGWGGATTTVAVATDAAADDFTMQTVNQYSTRNGGCIGHVVVGTADATANIRVTLGAARATLSFVVYQFRPDAGDEVELVAGPGSANAGSGSAPQSANISPSGTDLLCYAGAYNAAGVQQTSEQIGDEAADGSLDSNRLTGWYTIYDSSQTDIHAQCTFGDNDSWTCDIIALESAAASGGSEVLAGGVASTSDSDGMIWRSLYERGAPAGVSTVFGNIIEQILEALAGTITAVSSVTGAIWRRIFHAGAPVGTSDSDGSIWRRIFQVGAPAGISGSTGSIWRRIFHTGAPAGVSTVWGNIATELLEALAGAIEGISSLAGMISRKIYPSGGPVGNSGPTGMFFRDLFFVTAPAAISTLFGNIAVSAAATGRRFRIYMRAHKPRRL